jgi:SNF2 family DNA or RNA helicase
MTIGKVLENYLDDALEGDIHKAKRILKAANYQLKLTQKGIKVTIAVPSESRNKPYDVSITPEADDYLDVNCTCPAFNSYGDCKHAVAAIIYLKNELSEENVGENEVENEFEDEFYQDEYDEGELVEVVTELPGAAQPLASTLSSSLGRMQDGSFKIEMDSINITILMRLAGNAKDKELKSLANKTGAPFIEDRTFRFPIVEKKNSIFEVRIYFDGRTKFDTECTCGKKDSTLCLHTASAFYYLNWLHGSRYFDKFKTFEDEKNEVLKNFGLTLSDPEAAEFKWSTDFYGRLSLVSKPAYMVSANNTQFLNEFKQSLNGNEEGAHIRPLLPTSTMIDYEVGILFNFASQKHIGFELEALQIAERKGKEKITKLKLAPSNYSLLKPLPDECYNAVLKFSDDSLIEWISHNGNSYINRYHNNPWYQLNVDTKTKLQKHCTGLLQNNWNLLAEHPHLYLLAEGNFSQANIIPIQLSASPIEIGFKVERTEKFITIWLLLKLNGEMIKGNVRILSSLLFEVDKTLYLPTDQNYHSLLQRFKFGKLVFPATEQKNVLLNVIIPLQRNHSVEMQAVFEYEITEPTPQPRVLLSEMNEQHLVLRPQFLYGDTLLDYGPETEVIQEVEGKLSILKRNKGEEKKLYNFLRTLHPKFATQNNNQNYYLPFTEVLKNNWFFTMIKQVEATGYAVYGLKELKKFKYNTNLPKLDVEAGSGTDWFDLRMVATWGDQKVDLKDLRKAIINKQEAILLDDGTLGVIPQEWISQYRTLLKISNESNGTLKVSKLHFSLLGQLDGTFDNEEIKKEIEAKKKKLAGFSGIKPEEPSIALKATLRPYQLAGFEWMQALDEIGWGGCLADDMGLGKTLQAITFLQFVKEKNEGSTSLVVCPTSLLFNWESELQKFCPSLRYHVYYGTERAITQEHFEEYDLVLTSYGIMRIDLEELMKFHWHYVVLDESQAIKNPEAQVAKAVALLKAKNKLILSGTPVQNNTNDLFAQFNFLNPGLLGSREFFKEEFATAIDRHQDKAKAEQLRQLVYPFMLRRTKEQVAKDLPAKTETILWCIMGKAQRHLYDEYKNHYRNLLLKKIDEEGIGKAGIYVLEGLLRLRQICDHPNLLKDEEVTVNDSVKSEELLREIQENTGSHKLLVFSQFTEMLHLIRDDLKKNNISFCYLDGSTTASKRQEQVETFQQDSDVKVFLISLKAGGVGLNLTAADYVYLVDPWWNPAAEQQAIDRTHRIGQTQKVFAYKMICKDSVEEKILKLQEKKKKLANDLVSEDATFTKQLTRDDVAFLFS